MVDPELLAVWNWTFYGYGSWSAPYWFIGLEEGGVDSAEDFEKRVNAWDEMGQPDLLDLREFHLRIGHAEYCQPDAKLQSTWRRLMRSLFVAKGNAPTDESLRRYQAFELGRHGSEILLLELSPLPARGVNDRWYLRDDSSSLDFIDVEELREARRDHIAEAIIQHKPRAVICYGEPRKWAAYLSLHVERDKIWTGRRGATLIVASPQVRTVQANDHWDEIGRIIASKASSTDA